MVEVPAQCEFRSLRSQCKYCISSSLFNSEIDRLAVEAGVVEYQITWLGKPVPLRRIEVITSCLGCKAKLIILRITQL